MKSVTLKTLAKPASSKPAMRFSMLAVFGVATTIALTSRSAVEANRRINDLEKNEAKPEEKMLETWQIYIPPAIAATLTVLFILRASRLQRFRSEALLTAFIVEPFVTAPVAE